MIPLFPFISYDSSATIKSCGFTIPERKLGNIVSTPFTKTDANGSRKCVQVRRETIGLTTYSFLYTEVPVEEWKPEVIKFTQSTIEDIDSTIAELQEHRNRLAKELDTLKLPNYPTNMGALIITPEICLEYGSQSQKRLKRQPISISLDCNTPTTDANQ